MKPKYRLHFDADSYKPVIKKRVFRIFPSRVYPLEINHSNPYRYERKTGWFSKGVADYGVYNGKWIFMGYSA